MAWKPNSGGQGKAATVFSWLLELFFSFQLLDSLANKTCCNPDLWIGCVWWILLLTEGRAVLP